MEQARSLDVRKKFAGNLKDGVKNLHPAYFAMVMATGIVSIASGWFGMRSIGIALFWLNIVTYCILWLMTLARLIWFCHNFLSDLGDHQRGVGFFTLVAGTCVLGSQFVVFPQDFRIATPLWFLGILLWILLIYSIFTAFIFKETKPSLAEGIHGGWLLVVVATQSVSVLGGLLVPQFELFYREILFFTLAMWLIGGMLYIWMISLIFYRYIFFKVSLSDLSPPSWITMGAMAISTLAGTTLITNETRSILLQEMLPFLKGFTIFFWATGSWWIPVLIIGGIWRHIYKRYKFIYDPLYWGLVFPLGMYAAATFQLSTVVTLPFLYEMSRFFIYVALLAWTATFFGLVHSLLSKFIGKSFQTR